jgi:hypothetical protein
MHQLSTPAAAPAAVDPFKKQQPIASSVSFNNLAAARGPGAASASAADSSSKIIKGFASEHGM